MASVDLSALTVVPLKNTRRHKELRGEVNQDPGAASPSLRLRTAIRRSEHRLIKLDLLLDLSENTSQDRATVNTSLAMEESALAIANGALHHHAKLIHTGATLPGNVTDGNWQLSNSGITDATSHMGCLLHSGHSGADR